VTDDLAVLYGGRQRLDRESGSVMLDISFHNRGPTPIEGPLYLELENASSDFGDVEVGNYLRRGRSRKSSKMVPCRTGHVLAPGMTSRPCHLTLQFTKEIDVQTSKSDIARIRFRIFCLGSG